MHIHIAVIWLSAGILLALASEVPGYFSRRTSGYLSFTLAGWDGLLTVASVLLFSYAFTPLWLGVVLTLGGFSIASHYAQQASGYITPWRARAAAERINAAATAARSSNDQPT